MPELPDVIVYLESLDRLIAGQTIRGVRVRSPFVLRTFDPPIDQIAGHSVSGFSRRGKRIVWHLDNDLYLVVHPMIAGRFHWKRVGYQGKGKNDLLAIELDGGVMVLTEAAKQKRAGVWLVGTVAEVDQLDPGGINVLTINLQEFADTLKRSNNTLKRALTDPRRFDGIGNAYSDEILHTAKLSPLKRTQSLSAKEISRLYAATQSTLLMWIERLRQQTGEAFPEQVTAFRPEMSVHGKFKQPCPICQTLVQRIRYANSECNYCPRCQTEGRMLSDRSLARLMKDDWPKTIEELES